MKNHWSSIGSRLRRGASPNEIESFSAAYKVFLPHDMYEYYIAVDGMNEGETDSFLLHFFALNAVKPVTEALAQIGGIPDYRSIKNTLVDPESYFVFADYMIGSHVYAIHLSSEESATTPIIWICGSQWRVVAETFSEFCEKYFANREELLIAPI